MPDVMFNCNGLEGCRENSPASEACSDDFMPVSRRIGPVSIRGKSECLLTMWGDDGSGRVPELAQTLFTVHIRPSARHNNLNRRVTHVQIGVLQTVSVKENNRTRMTRLQLAQAGRSRLESRMRGIISITARADWTTQIVAFRSISVSAQNIYTSITSKTITFTSN